ncbi:MAG: phosphotransferase [Vulcanimicrobiota bacterium]
MRVPQEVVKAFLPQAENVEAKPLGSGHIHRTELVESSAGQHVFQRLNSEVFPDLQLMMGNITQVTAAMRQRGEPTLDFLTVAGSDSYLARDQDGGTWRCSVHYPDTLTYDIPPSPAHLKNAARAFARFGQTLSAHQGFTLHPTIADFHHTPKRFEAMEKAWRDAPDERRALPDYFALRQSANSFPEFGLHGLLPPQVVHAVSHNDTKLNNCLFQEGSDQVVCVIDLDTVMEGNWLMDFGDLCRTSICPAPEDAEDLDEIQIDLQRFGALVEGYAEVLKDSVSQAEIDRMVYSVFLLTYELALRFFTDYLQKDRYFGAKYPQHNLVRTRSQLTLALKVTALRKEMEGLVRESFGV